MGVRGVRGGWVCAVEACTARGGAAGRSTHPRVHQRQLDTLDLERRPWLQLKDEARAANGVELARPAVACETHDDRLPAQLDDLDLGVLDQAGRLVDVFREQHHVAHADLERGERHRVVHILKHSHVVLAECLRRHLGAVVTAVCNLASMRGVVDAACSAEQLAAQRVDRAVPLVLLVVAAAEHDTEAQVEVEPARAVVEEPLDGALHGRRVVREETRAPRCASSGVRRVEDLLDGLERNGALLAVGLRQRVVLQAGGRAIANARDESRVRLVALPVRLCQEHLLGGGVLERGEEARLLHFLLRTADHDGRDLLHVADEEHTDRHALRAEEAQQRLKMLRWRLEYSSITSRSAARSRARRSCVMRPFGCSRIVTLPSASSPSPASSAAECVLIERGA